jgi:hypothetical protein
VPSFAPTSAPTPAAGNPTTAPTSAKSALIATLQADLATIKSTVIYQDLFVNGVSGGVGGCNRWLSGTGSNLNALFVTRQATNVSLISYNDNSKSRELKTCNDKVSSEAILNAVYATTTAQVEPVTTETTCGSEIWKSRKCADSSTALCVDCDDPCGTTQCPSLNTFNPCGATNGNTYGCPTTNIDINAYRVLTATFVPISIAPLIESIEVTSTDSSLRVVVALKESVDGIVYCAEYVKDVVPVSVTDIVLQNHVAMLSASSKATINIGRLLPQSDYDIYCVSQSNLGTFSSLADALKLKKSSKTTGFKILNILVSIQSLYVNSKSLNSIKVTLDGLPSPEKPLTLSLGTVLGGADFVPLVPASINVTNTIQTNELTFSIAEASSVTPGTLKITARLTGSDEYRPVFVLKDDFEVIALNVAPAVPRFLSVQFSNDGTSLRALFNTDTNQGGITTSFFACSLLFEFPDVAGMASATCSWTSPSVVTISAGSGASIAVGNSLTLKGGDVNKIQAFCSVGSVGCADYGNVGPTTVSVLAPLRAVIPVVKISAPLRIGSCDDYVFNIGTSSGGGGRAFTSTSFSVSTSNSAGAEAAQRVQDFYTTDYQLSPPTAVPSGTFPTGLANIVVTVCNFLQQCGTAAQQLTVLTMYVYVLYSLLSYLFNCHFSNCTMISTIILSYLIQCL